MEDRKKEFNNNKYGGHKALASEDNFFTDKVYLNKIAKNLVEIFKKTPSEKRLLEVGCADGSFLLYLKREGLDVFGVDISEKVVCSAKSKGLEVVCGDVEKQLGFPDDFFDFVVASEVIEHLYDTDFFLSELRRVAKAKGYLFLSTPNLASLKNRFRLLIGAYPQYSEYRLGQDQAGHIRNYTANILVKQLEKNGWEVKKVISPNFIFPMTKNFPLAVKKLFMFLGDLFPTLGSHIIVISRKI